ncbi:MAG TPA: preprotein translocase subunit SecG [Oceanipulchritudo sp.]|nr:preprotein translocase subunit SecG [Oceanipulchritudo sp.]
MLNILISLLTFALILISLFLVLVILMQRANSNAGMGSAFGGGVAESAFGTETTNVLVKATKWSALAFFVIALVLYLLFMSREGSVGKVQESDLPDIPVVEQSQPVMTEEAVATTADSDTIDAAVTQAQEAVQVITEEASTEIPVAGEPTPGP